MSNEDALQHVMLHALASSPTHAGQIPAGLFRMPTPASRQSSATAVSDIGHLMSDCSHQSLWVTKGHLGWYAASASHQGPQSGRICARSRPMGRCGRIALLHALEKGCSGHRAHPQS